jgi:thymidylate synthase
MAGERGYLDLLSEILRDGSDRRDRTGTGTRSVFGRQLRFDLSDHRVPAVTTKKLAWKTCIEELLWFLRGSTDSTELGSKIWEGNTTRAFLDARGLADLPEGDIGAGYGFQWRHFGAEYKTCKDAYDGEGFDQIKYVERLIREEPTSRRIVMTAWNPAALDRMALPPCHVLAQFYVEPEAGSLRCHLVMRSADCFLGLPFNIFGYAVMTHLLAARAGLAAKELVVSLGDAHLYQDHLEMARTQVARTPGDPPRVRIRDPARDLGDLRVSDFELEDYVHQAALRAPMSV